MTQVQPSSTSVKRGRTLKLRNAAKNQGAANAGTFVIGFRLSLNNVYGDTDDVIINTTRSITSLAANASTSIIDTSLSIPSSTQANSYYVCAKADAGSGVTESNEDNNALCSTIKVQVTR